MYWDISSVAVQTTNTIETFMTNVINYIWNAILLFKKIHCQLSAKSTTSDKWNICNLSCNESYPVLLYELSTQLKRYLLMANVIILEMLCCYLKNAMPNACQIRHIAKWNMCNPSWCCTNCQQNWNLNCWLQM